MTSLNLLSFEEALALKPPRDKCHILLGNGFSRAWRDNVFSYDALLDQADFNALSTFARPAFDALLTTDFEAVMRAMRASAKLARLYMNGNQSLADKLEQDADGLREVLVQAIAGRHPARPHEITESEYGHVRTFLSKFDDIYTLNYDLLLYWALMQSGIVPEIRHDDGFRTPEAGADRFVTWEVENTDKQTVFYLHGALHIFDAGHEVQKFTWTNTQEALVDQIRNALNANTFPIYVSEGNTNEKLAKIKHSDFLARSYRSFSKITGTLFVYGHSMHPNDDHILQRIEKNRCTIICVGLFGDPSSESNASIRSRAAAIASARPRRRPLDVHFFDASSANVWRS